MVDGAVMCARDIPLCPCTMNEPPKKLVSWKEARAIHRKAIANKDFDYHIDAWVHFFIDDQAFDGPDSGIWRKPKQALEIISHFSGVITPDFSSYQDFPESIRMINLYRARAFGFWVGMHGVEVCNSIRWGDVETWDACFLGCRQCDPVFVGVVASNLRNKHAAELFHQGFARMLEELGPSKVLFYGAPDGPTLSLLSEHGVGYAIYESDTAKAHRKASERHGAGDSDE